MKNKEVCFFLGRHLPHANLKDSESCRNSKMQISEPKNMFLYFLLFWLEKYYHQLSYAFGMKEKEFLSSENEQFSVLSFFLPVTVVDKCAVLRA